MKELKCVKYMYKLLEMDVFIMYYTQVPIKERKTGRQRQKDRQTERL